MSLGSDLAGNVFGVIGRKIIQCKIPIINDISPNKTIIGYVASYLFSIIVLKLFKLNINIKEIIGFTSVAISGDLLSSLIKRKLGKKQKHKYPYGGNKDFSQLLGEHGGFCDRFDSFIALYPVLTAYCVLNKKKINCLK